MAAGRDLGAVQTTLSLGAVAPTEDAGASPQTVNLAALEVEAELPAIIASPAVSVGLAPLEVEAELGGAIPSATASQAISPLEVEAELGGTSVTASVSLGLAPLEVEAELGGVTVNTGLVALPVAEGFSGSSGPDATQTDGGQGHTWALLSNEGRSRNGSGIGVEDASSGWAEEYIDNLPATAGVEVTVVKKAGSVAVLARVADASNYWKAEYAAGSAKLKVYKVVGGSPTQVGSDGSAVSNNQEIGIRITGASPNIAVVGLIDGVEDAATAATGQSGPETGSVGIRLFNGASVDDFSAIAYAPVTALSLAPLEVEAELGAAVVTATATQTIAPIEVEAELGAITLAAVAPLSLSALEVEAELGALTVGSLAALSLSPLEVEAELGGVTLSAATVLLMAALEVEAELGGLGIAGVDQGVSIAALEVEAELGGLVAVFTIDHYRVTLRITDVLEIIRVVDTNATLKAVDAAPTLEVMTERS